MPAWAAAGTQEETLRGKAKCLANIEELERLVPLLREALREERAGLEASLGEGARASAEEAAAAKVADAESVRAPPPCLPLWRSTPPTTMRAVLCATTCLTSKGMHETGDWLWPA